MLLGKYKIADESFNELAIKFMTPKQIQKALNFDALSKREFRGLIKKIEEALDGKIERVKRPIKTGG